MHDQIKQALISAAQWTRGQVPDVIHQLIVWNITQDIMLIALPFLFALVVWRIIKIMYRQMKTAGASDITDMGGLGLLWYFALLLHGLALAASLVVGITAVFDLVQLLIAPKAWLLEYTAHLLHR